MKIVIAKTAGFCMGVRRAVDMVLDASTRYQEPIFTYGPLIHNPQVLQMLEEKKIFRIERIPEKGSGIVLIRAHGVPPEDQTALKQAGFTVINATCPRVVRVQVIINRYAKKGYSTIIAGDKNHPEVIGLLGYAKGKGHTITSMEEFLLLPWFENAIVVAQTTQNMSFYDGIKTWCQTHAPHYRVFDTICGSTEKRQTEIRKLAEENDAVIVVGGKESGNTRRLAEIAAGTGKPSIHIEDAAEIDYETLSHAKSIALTAGASTPNWIITDTYRKVENNLQKRHAVKAALYLFRDFLLKTNIMASIGAASLTYACSRLQGNERDFRHALIAMLYVLSMQIMNNLFAIRSDRYNHPKRAHFYKENHVYLWILAVLSGGTGLYLSFLSGVVSFVLLLIMSFLGLSYNQKIIPIQVKKGKTARIKDIPGSKTILIVIAWGTVTCLLPAVVIHGNPFSVVVAFLFVTGLVFARTAFFDILAIQGDRITGKETLPILLGEKQSFNIIKYTLIFEIGLVFVSYSAGLLVNRAFFLAFIPFVMFLLIRFFEKDRLVSGGHREFIIEFLLIATGLLSAVI
ncbi:MAG: 4-hydroxy-3-methylbut-2-enyl diphosphate reductase [Desulfobacterales bacterium RIFOXYA12_FULL_46_15]|nr:MAG: 4-hydroxy-3-methylbut-2-enyl diphosphate reductase [Desulfobacterales bacterium RIFOXYA12_FULL_46_15]